MSLSAIDYALWISGPVLLTGTFGALVKRRLVRQLPVFSLYVVFHVFRTLVLAAIHRLQPNSYFRTYWFAESISILLGFAVVYELYTKIFHRYKGLHWAGGMLFGCGAVLLLLAAVVAAAANSGADSPGVVKALVLLERSVRVMQCGLLGFLFLVTVYLGLPWRSHLFGIALGFGVFASIELAAVALRSHLGPAFASVYSQVRAAAYAGCVLIWVAYLLARERAESRLVGLSHRGLEKWNQVLVEIRGR